MKTEHYFCPRCYAIREFQITSGGMAHCPKGCTFFEKDLIKMGGVNEQMDK